jgi:hypothetical protein
MEPRISLNVSLVLARTHEAKKWETATYRQGRKWSVVHVIFSPVRLNLDFRSTAPQTPDTRCKWMRWNVKCQS